MGCCCCWLLLVLLFVGRCSLVVVGEWLVVGVCWLLLVIGEWPLALAGDW